MEFDILPMYAIRAKTGQNQIIGNFLLIPYTDSDKFLQPKYFQRSSCLSVSNVFVIGDDVQRWDEKYQRVFARQLGDVHHYWPVV